MLYTKAFIITFMFLLPLTINGFSTLSELNQMIQHYPESLESDNDDVNDPDYSTFHQKNLPSFFGKIFQRFGLQKKPLWNTNHFKSLLTNVVEHRERSCTGEYVVKFLMPENTHCIIWGDLHGAFHSLIRALNELKNRKIINDALEIIDQRYYFIFNGDAIDRSAYILETLTIIVLLMYKNPDRVIYIRGKHEYQDYWLNFGLKRELEIKAEDGKAETTEPTHFLTVFPPFYSLLKRFFNTLPLAMYIQYPNDMNHVLRISHFTRGFEKIDEHYMGDLFNNNDKKVVCYNLASKKKTETPISVSAIIETEEVLRWRSDYRGLTFLEPDAGSVAWSVLAGQIPIYRSTLDFVYDALVELIIGKTLASSTLTLFNQDARNPQGFLPTHVYNLLSGRILDGAAITDQNPIMLGSTMALTKGIFKMGQHAVHGIIACINRENQLGGIKGQSIRFVVYDDQYTAHLARKNVEKLLDEHIDLILLPLGSRTLQGYLDFVKEGKILVLFPITGASQYRSKNIKNIIHWRTSYGDEVKALINYILKEYSMTQFAFFYQNDAYGLDLLEFAHKESQKHNITHWTDVPYALGEIDFKDEVNIIRKAQPETIGLFSTGLGTAQLIRQLGTEHVMNKKLFGPSVLGEENFRVFLRSRGIDVQFAAAVPNPATSQLEIVKEYRQEMDKNSYSYDIFSLEAYIGTSILLDRMKTIKGPITISSVLESLESIKNYDYKGLKLSFDPETRSLLHNVWLETAPDEEWIQVDIKA